MKKRYILMFLIITFLLTGCTVDYQINIDEDLTVNEKINYEYTNTPNGEEDGGVTTDYIKEVLDYGKGIAKENNYEITDNSSDNNVEISFKKSDNISSFQNPIVLKDIYSDFKSYCNNSFCSITAKSIKNQIEGDGNVTDYKTSITVPFKVIKNNADEVNFENNTYTWYYVVNGTQSNIELIFERHGKNIIEENKTKSNINFWIWIIILLTISVFIGIIIRKIFRNNRPRL